MTIPISHILASSSEVWVDQKTDTNTALKNLKKGQLIEAKVDKAVSPRQAQLLIQGKTVSARTYVPLQPGQVILLKATDAGPQPLFKFVETKGENLIHVPQGALETLGRRGPYELLFRILETIRLYDVNGKDRFQRKIFERIENLVKSFSIKSSHPDIRSIIKRSGISWEYKLSSALKSGKPLPAGLVQRLVDGDLKGLALQLAVSLSEEGESLSQDIRAFIESLDRLQLLNSHASKETGRYALPLPVLLDESLRFGQIYIDLGKDSDADPNKSDRVIRVSLLLEMSNLGHIQADLAILKNALTGSLGVESDAIRFFIETHVPLLIKKLKKSGFEVHDMTCRTVSPEAIATASLTNQLVDLNEGVLNIVI